MGYRFSDNPPKPEDHLRRLDVRNGAIMRATFACYYAHMGHDHKLHDHIGWPNPDVPDHICQMLPDFMHPWWHRKDRPIAFEPIHLIEEGYDETSVTFEDDDIAQYLTANTFISELDDNLIKMTIHADFPTFHDKPKETRFTVFASKSDGSVIDAVCYGIVTILPGSPMN